MFKKIQVKIESQTPILMHRFPLEPVEAMEKKTKEEQAEIAAYRDPGGNLYVPGINIQRCFVSGATYSKGKGRASLQKPVAASVSVFPERVGLGVDKYEIDARAVVNPTTKGRIVRYRPRLDKWELQFVVEYDDILLTEIELRRVIDDSGLRVGLLDFRPEKKGPFGRFVVVEWEKYE